MKSDMLDLVGIGLYSIPEAARLLHVNAPTLRRWADGYTFRRRGEGRVSRPIIQREVRAEEMPGVLTFLDFMELHFVARFRSQKVSIATIRLAAEVASRLFGTDHPFAVKRFDTDGRSIFATLEGSQGPTGMSEEQFMLELHTSQHVFGELALAFLKNLDYGAEEIQRYWPMGREERVVIDPLRAFGQPIDADTGVATHALFLASQSGESTKSIAAWYGVPVEAVTKAVEYERGLMAA